MLVSINSTPSEDEQKKLESELKIETSTASFHEVTAPELKSSIEKEEVEKGSFEETKLIETSPNSISSNISVEYSESKSKDIDKSKDSTKETNIKNKTNITNDYVSALK